MRPLAMAALSFALFLYADSAYAAAQLSDYQQKIHDEVKAGLDAVEQSLADARTKLDAGDASGAGGSYNTAVRNYNNHIRRLGQLPADNSSAIALRERARSLGVTLKETDALIKAGPDRQPEPGEAPVARSSAPAPAAAKLDYKQEQSLKNVRFYLGEIEPRANRIFELTAGRLDADAITEALELMKFVHQRMGYTVKALNSLPADHPQVAAEAKRYNDLLAKLVTAQDAIQKAAPDADRQVAGMQQQVADDLAMIDSWSQSLGNPQFLFDNRPDDAVAVVGQLPQMRQATTAMLQRWTERAGDKPNDQTAADMVRKLTYVDRQLADLEAYANELSTRLPEQIAADLVAVDALIETAVSERRPMYFWPDGGIAQQLGFAEQRMKMLTAMDPAAAERAGQSLTATRDKSREAQKTLSQDIIRSNKKPAERYTGPDVEELRRLVAEKWSEAHPDDEIIAVVFNTEGWRRTTRWDWSRASQSFGKVDYDHIQPKLFYRHDDAHAVEVPVEVYKDYMNAGRIAIKPWEREPDPPVTRIYLLEAFQ